MVKMSRETIAIAAVGATLLVATMGMGAFMFNAISAVRGDVADLRLEVRSDVADLRADMADLRTDMADLSERMARLEGRFDGFIGSGGESGA